MAEGGILLGRENTGAAGPDGRRGADRNRFVAAHRGALVDELASWVRIASIAGDADHAEALRWSAQHLAARCRAVGFPRTEVWPQGESFAVFAEWLVRSDAPTVLVYSHHDVRAVRDERWEQTSPFEPVMRDGKLYGRGASDAKGQVCAHLLGLAAHVAAKGRPSVNVRVLVEGEEELGSPHLADLMDKFSADLAADLVIFSDTMLLDADQPAVCTSVRGMLGATVTVHGPAVDVHSGTVSGSSPNPIHDLAKLVAALHDDRGRIAVPGMEDDVREPHADRRAEYADLGLVPADWVERTEITRAIGVPGLSLPERLWARPAIEVISISGGDADGLPRAVIPATANAELSIRLADGQDVGRAAAQLERWVAAQLRHVRYELTFSRLTAQPPYRTPEHPAVEVLAEAMARGFRVDKVGRMGNGGGGPADLLARAAGAPVLFFGTGLPSDRWHAPDEHVRLDVLERGAATMAEFWELLPAAFA